jgi:hypothetical protein
VSVGSEVDANIARQRARDEALMAQGQMRREIDAALQSALKKQEAETLTAAEAIALLHFINGDSHMVDFNVFNEATVKLQTISGEEW